MEVSAGPAHKSAPVCRSLSWLLQGRELRVVPALILGLTEVLSQGQGTLSGGTVQELLDFTGARPHLQGQGWAGQHRRGPAEQQAEQALSSPCCLRHVPQP